MFQLPQDLINLIYEFDGTKRENFNKVLEEFSDIINTYNINHLTIREIKYMCWREQQIKKNEIELEKYENEIKKYYHIQGWKINFGKYKGSQYRTLPDYYTEWLLNKDILKEDLKTYFTLKEKIKDIEREISFYRRDGYD